MKKGKSQSFLIYAFILCFLVFPAFVSAEEKSTRRLPDAADETTASNPLLPSLPTNKGDQTGQDLTEKLPHCGDGIVEGQERCDDTNLLNGDGCSSECQIEPEAKCGDGRVSGAEECDDGNLSDGDGCSSLCRAEGCGDGKVQAGRGEACDDGNLSDGDGCNSSCQLERCGDGVVQASRGETCDDGNGSNGDGCSASCVLEGCGDGIIQASRNETCDDGNTSSGDGCSDICKAEFCGDGVVQLNIGEFCDDGNRLDGDGCSSLCRSEVPPNVEACPAVDNNPGICSKESQNGSCSDAVCPGGIAPICSGNTSCGDGSCQGICCSCPVCGNGVQETGEGCDDGNTTPGDGCSAICGVETGEVPCSTICTAEGSGADNFTGSCSLDPAAPASQPVSWTVTSSDSSICTVTGFSATGSTTNFNGVFVPGARGKCVITATPQAGICTPGSARPTNITVKKPTGDPVCTSYVNWDETDDDGVTPIPLAPDCGSHHQHDCASEDAWEDDDGDGACTCPVEDQQKIDCGGT